MKNLKVKFKSRTLFSLIVWMFEKVTPIEKRVEA